MPAEAWSRAGQQLLAPYPLPNAEGGALNLIQAATRRTDAWQHAARLEYAPPGRWKAGVRFSRDLVVQRLPFQGSSLGNAPVERRRTSDAATLRLTRARNPKSVDAFSIATTRSAQSDRSLAPLLDRSRAGYQALELPISAHTRWNFPR